MNKKGLELTLSTIIIAILVILVLVVVAAFFLGGMGNLTKQIQAYLTGTTGGYAYTLAVQNCESYCRQANLLPSNLKQNSAYCTATQFVDKDNNGEADKEGDKLINYYCPLPLVTIKNEKTPNFRLDVSCIDDNTGAQLNCV